MLQRVSWGSGHAFISLTCCSFVRKFGNAWRLGLEPRAPLADTNAKVAGIPGRRLGNVINNLSL